MASAQEAPEQHRMKTCFRCGSSIDKESRWCPNCFALQSDKSA